MNNLSFEFSNSVDFVATGPKRGSHSPAQCERKAQNAAAAGNLHDGCCYNIVSFGSKIVALKKKRKDCSANRLAIYEGPWVTEVKK